MANSKNFYYVIDFFHALHWGEANHLGAKGKP
jgi:hypothetical protein